MNSIRNFSGNARQTYENFCPWFCFRENLLRAARTEKEHDHCYNDGSAVLFKLCLLLGQGCDFFFQLLRYETK